MRKIGTEARGDVQFKVALNLDLLYHVSAHHMIMNSPSALPSQ